jgi:hypothetical protein
MRSDVYGSSGRRTCRLDAPRRPRTRNEDRCGGVGAERDVKWGWECMYAERESTLCLFKQEINWGSVQKGTSVAEYLDDVGFIWALR